MCDDYKMCQGPVCALIPETCGDEEDNNGDGLVDCQDESTCACQEGYFCTSNYVCEEEQEEIEAPEEGATCSNECQYSESLFCCEGFLDTGNSCIRCSGKVQLSDCVGKNKCKAACGAKSMCKFISLLD